MRRDRVVRVAVVVTLPYIRAAREKMEDAALCILADAPGGIFRQVVPDVVVPDRVVERVEVVPEHLVITLPDDRRGLGRP
jgi:hypothetical protein